MIDPRAGAPSRPPDGLDRFGLAALLVVIAALVVVWLTGEVGGLLVSGQWPAVGLSETIAVTFRLPSVMSDPSRAWPPLVRTQLPAGAWLYLVAGLVGSTLAGGASFVFFRLRRRLMALRARARRTPESPWRRPSPNAGPTGRWATRRDVAPLRVACPGRGRLVLGRVGHTLVATEARHSVLVLGPTQSGKTTGLAIPSLLEWEGPVVATSVKGDLVGVTRAHRATLGHTWMFDPTGTAGAGPSSRWSPLKEVSSWTGAQRMAAWLVESTPARAGLSEGAFWFAAAAKLLAPLLLAAVAGGRSMSDVVRWTNLQESDEVEQLLGDAGEVEAGVALFASLGRDDRIRSSVFTTLETVLAPYEDPTVATSAECPDIDPIRLLSGAHTLYLCGPAHEQARVQGVFAALVASVVNTAVERMGRLGRPLDPPLLLVLDEAANIAPLRDLDTLASTAAGLGIQLVTVCQDLAQLAARYGTERARTISNNHRAKVILSGIADVGTLDTLSGLAGEHAVRQETVTADLRDGRRSRSSSIGYRRLAPPDELRRIRPGEGMLIYGHLPVARLTLRPWFQDRVLMNRAAPPTRPGRSPGLRRRQVWPAARR